MEMRSAPSFDEASAPRNANGATVHVRCFAVQRCVSLMALVAMAAATAVVLLPAAALAAPSFEMPFPCGETWFGWTYSGHSPSENSIDWNLSPSDGDGDLGRAVVAASPGTASVAYQASGYGNYVTIDHGGGWSTRYAHLSSVAVANGQAVAAGQQVGAVGKSGGQQYSHLHFEERLNGVVQPSTFHGAAFAYHYYPNGIYQTSQNCGSGPPPSDRDGDGTPDSADRCPSTTGPGLHGGCPYFPFARHLSRFSSGSDHFSLTGGTPAGYGYERPLLVLVMTAGPGRHPLYACKVGGDTFTSPASNCEGQTAIGLLGWAYDAQQPLPTVTQPLYRCTVKATGEHFDSTDGTCEGQNVESIVGWGLAEVSWARWNNGTDHYSSTAVSPGNYALEQTFGDLLTVQVLGTHPLWACKVGSDTFTSPASNCEGQAVIGLLGFAYDQPPTNAITRPVYRCAIKATGEHFDSWGPDCEGQTVESTLGWVLAQLSLNRWTNGEHFTTNAMGAPIGYSYENTLGDLLGVNTPGTHPIYACKVGGDEFSSTTSTCEGQTVIGLLGFAFDGPPPGMLTRAFYRCTVKATGEHFDSPDPSCEGQTTESRLGYLLMGQATATGDGFTPVTPSRVLDSRPTGPQAGPYGTPWVAGTVREVQIGGVGGVPADTDAVALNVTVTNPTAASFLTLYPSGTTRPNASNLNWVAGQTTPIAVTVKLGAGGKLSVFNASGSTDVIVDVVGYYRAAAADGYAPVSPTRILDSRPSGPQVGPFASPWGPGASRDVTVAGTTSVPAGADAVVLNVTATSTSAASFLTLHPAGTPRPNASSLNWVAGQTVANAVTAKVGANGKVTVFNASGSVDVIIDVVGYFTSGAGVAFHPVSPARVLDSRPSGPAVGAYQSPWGSQTTRDVALTGVGGIPGTRPTAVLLNATVTNTTAASFLSLWPAGFARPAPLVSSVNWSVGQTTANAVTAPVGANGAITVFNASGTVDVIADAAGWYG